MASMVRGGFTQLVGRRRMVKLVGPSRARGCDIWGKCEWENPGGSVKDRAAWWMILEAEKAGLLVPGEAGVIVEGTAGNTGIGLALAGRACGYNTVIVLADTQSREKKDLLQRAGAMIVDVPAVPYSDPNNYVHVAQKLAARLADVPEVGRVFYSNQWDNLANRQAHFESTGPEIFEALDGKIDAFSCAVGTGGTISGVGSYLRQVRPQVKICLTDPCGAALVRYYNDGELGTNGSSISEGIGQGRLTGNMAHENFRPDHCYEIHDKSMMEAIIQLHSEEGLSIGLSAGINVAGAIRVAEKLGPGHTVVTVLCDRANRYASKIYNPEFLELHGLPVPHWCPQPAHRDSSFTNIHGGAAAADASSFVELHRMVGKHVADIIS